MTETNLQDIFNLLCTGSFAGLGVAQADALVRVCIAYNDVLCTVAYDDFDGRRRIAAIADALYDALRIEEAKGESSDIRHLEMMFRLAKDFTMSVYGKKDEECSRLYRKAIPELISAASDEEEIYAMRCIVYELGNAIGDISDLWDLRWFGQRCRSWVAAADASGRWDGVDETVAVHRLMLLQDNSMFFGDRSLDKAVQKIYAAYRSGLDLQASVTEHNVNLFAAWHDLLKNSFRFDDEPLMRCRIAGMLEEFSNRVPDFSDGWHMAMGHVFEEACLEIQENIQHEIFAETA